MSLQGLLKELDRTKAAELEKRMEVLREKHAADLLSKDREIASLREEIGTLRRWLDHSALPAFNPISKREDAMGLVKMNFGPDKPAPEFWAPGEKELLDSVESRPEPFLKSLEEAAFPGDDNHERPIPRGPIPKAPEFVPPSRDLSHEERPSPPADLPLEGTPAFGDQDIPDEITLNAPLLPEFKLPELDLPEAGPGAPETPLQADEPKPAARKPAAAKPAKKRPSRKTSFPSVRKATEPRRKAAAKRAKTK